MRTMSFAECQARYAEVLDRVARDREEVVIVPAYLRSLRLPRERSKRPVVRREAPTHRLQ